MKKQKKKKIVKCPKCKKPIKYLNLEEMTWVLYKVGLKDGALETKSDGSMTDTADPNGDNTHYYCPECGEQITEFWDRAEKFLQGVKRYTLD